MGDHTAIEWTEASWNPLTGCDKVSDGCTQCYAESIAHRFDGTPAYPNGFAVTLRPERLDQPMRWRRPRRIFVNSMSDLFHDQVPDDYIARVWQAMGCAPQHTYQILTKRHARMRSWVTRWYAGEIAEPYEVRAVPGYPGYRISTLGEVFGKRADTVGGLSYDVGEQGHRRVTMHREGSPRSGDRELVHRLVLTTFVRSAVAGEQACHRNGDPSDNRLSNLYWGSQSENWRDRIGHGNGRSWSKLSEADVAIIRKRAEVGESAYRIAQDFPVSDTQIRNVLRGDQWTTPTDVQRPHPPARAVLDCVWLGVSTENQRWADIRIPALLDTPAAVRFISAEPLIGPIKLRDEWLEWTNGRRTEQGERGLPGGRVGGAVDRLPGASVAPCRTQGEPLDWVHCDDPLCATTCRESGGQVPAGAGDVRRQEDSCTCTPVGVETFQRTNPAGPNRESQERQAIRQSAVESRAVDESRPGAPRSEDLAPRKSQSVRSAQSDGEAHDRAGPGDLLTPCGRRATTGACSGVRGDAADDLSYRSGGSPLAWIIVGGESGHGARPMHPQWVRDIRDQCQAAGVAFLHKQNGEWIEDVTIRPAEPEFGIDEPYRLLNIPPDHKNPKRCVMHLGGGTALTPDNPFNPFRAGHPGWTAMRRVGKKAAGRELDGRTWDQYPEAVTV